MATQRVYQSKNPWTGVVKQTYPDATRQQIEEVLAKLSAAPTLNLQQRQEYLTKFADGLAARKEELVISIVEDMGKPISLANMEVDFSVAVTKYYADNLVKFLSHEEIVENGFKKGVRYDPMGIVLCVKPFNFPMLVPFMGIPSILAAGNKVILKPTECCPTTALIVAEVAKQSGFDGYFETLFVTIPDLEFVISDARVAGVSFTGHTNNGKILAGLCGKYMKKITCELGGNDPFVVLEDANVDEAVKLAAQARLTNSGQICINAKRFIVHQNLYDQFVDKLAQEVKTNWNYGDPKDPATVIGPIARDDFVENIDKQVQASISEGAVCKLGGKRREGPASIYEVTILADVKREYTCWQQEIFGPVFTVAKGATNEDLIRMANDTQYGLAAVVYTGNPQKTAEEVLPKIEAGNVAINSWTMSAFDFRFGFGGCKNSGIGRELGPNAVREFVNEKTYYIKM